MQYFDDGGLRFYRWNGSTLVRRPASGMTAGYTAGVLNVAAPKTAFDGATSFNLLTVSSRGQDVGEDEDLIASDSAPNSGRGRWVSPGPLSVADLAGDHEAAPDVTDVRVTDSASGTISFAVSTPSHAALTAGTWIELDVDIDRRHSTGGGGAETFVALSGGRCVRRPVERAEGDFVTSAAQGLVCGTPAACHVRRPAAVPRRRRELRLLRRQRRLRFGRRGQRDRSRAER